MTERRHVDLEISYRDGRPRLGYLFRHQMFFDFKKKPAVAKLGLYVDDEEFELKLSSEPFAIRGYKRIAVKVVDVYGNESTVVHELAGKG